jgi:nucleoside phosphorylase
MKALIFAYKAEADTFIKNLNLKSLPNKQKSLIYKNSDIVLLIAGQGIFNSIIKLTEFYAEYKNIEQVYNFGIAGRLDENLNLENVYQVNMVLRPGLPKFNLGAYTNGVSCVSSDWVIGNKKEAQVMSRLGQLVDMELWGVAYVCDYYNIQLQAVKIISDDARTEVALELIKSKSKFYSEELFNYYRNNF